METEHASGIVIRYDRDAGDATVFECGFRDHGYFLWWGGLVVGGKQGRKTLRGRSQVMFNVWST